MFLKKKVTAEEFGDTLVASLGYLFSQERFHRLLDQVPEAGTGGGETCISDDRTCEWHIFGLCMFRNVVSSHCGDNL